MAELRTVRPIVSPVASAAAMMAVPSMEPTTMSALRPGRRRILRTPMRKNTGFRPASTPTAARAATESAASTTASWSTGMPNSLVMTRRSPDRDGRCLGEYDLVGLAARRGAVHGRELRYLLRVETASPGETLVSVFLGRPKGEDECLALGREEDVGPLVTGP